MSILRAQPDKADPPRVKRLHGYKDLWRMRVADDYRLVYRCDHGKKTVTLLMLGPRGSIYDRLGADDAGEPGVRIVARAEELLEKEPTEAERGLAEISLEDVGFVAEHSPDNSLPARLSDALLDEWSVDRQYWRALAAVRTEGQLLGLSGTVPDAVLERVVAGLWPPTIEQIAQTPTRVAADPAELEAAARGLRDLDGFLLQLDEEQAAFVARFAGRDRPTGPWLLKGGPGSGKSTVALYCIQSLVRQEEGRLNLNQRPLRILFTTFTKSLKNASQHLAQSLGIAGSRHQVDHANVDGLATKYLASAHRHLTAMDSKRGEMLLEQVVGQLRQAERKFPFVASDVPFLFEEFDWVIGGDGLLTEAAYLKAERSGRGRPLTQNQRREVWKCWEHFRARLRKQGHWLFGERLADAARNATSTYDYVFIDEAQDLRPAALRFCVALCRDKRNVFLTADLNQSIYGHSMSWSKVAEELKFTGRTRILRRSYRNTHEVWEALRQLAPDGQDVDKETLDVEPVYNGPYPVLVKYRNPQAAAKRLNAFLHDALLEERVAPGCAAVLCPGSDQMNEAIRLIDPAHKPRIMRAKDLDISYPGVKVTTMHAAKGLQFPVVVVFGVKQGTLPKPIPAEADGEEHLARQGRLLFVACSRAMRRLLVLSDQNHPSPFLANLTDACWEVEEV